MNEQEKLFEDFKKWQEQVDAEQAKKEPPFIDVSELKAQLNNRQPMQVPREYVFAAAAGAIVLILSAWPVLILGAILGGFVVMKLGCPLTGSKHNEGDTKR